MKDWAVGMVDGTMYAVGAVPFSGSSFESSLVTVKYGEGWETASLPYTGHWFEVSFSEAHQRFIAVGMAQREPVEQDPAY